MPEWISVKDRLPEIYEDVLVIDYLSKMRREGKYNA
nr:MAG TPA: Protein of unknown function (DUF551) [Caudoviricetes sp.]